MASYEGSEEIAIAAPPATCFAVMTAYEDLPRWQGPLVRCTVCSRDEHGRGRDVEYVVDAKFRRVRYRLRHSYDEPGRIDSEYLEGDFRGFSGRWRFEADGRGTLATVAVAIDPGRRLPGALVRAVHGHVLRSAARDLRREAERAG